MVIVCRVTLSREPSRATTTEIPTRTQLHREPREILGVGPRISNRSIRIVTQAGILVVGGSPEQRIAALGTAQRGRTARWQLLAAGLSDDMIRTRVSNGLLIRVRHGVYAVGHRSPMQLADEVSALLTAPPGTLLSHLTAARIWRLHTPAAAGLLPVDILVDDGGGRHVTGVREHRTRQPHRMARVFVDDLPVTSPEQTLLDIAPLVGARELERALDEALASGLTSRRQVSEAASRNIRRAGSADLRALTLSRGPLTLTRSQAEERFLALIREAKLPAPEVNVRLHGFTVDFFWRDAGVVVELDGYQWHSSRSAFERDRRKDAAMRTAGLRLTRLTWEAINLRALEIVANVARELAPRAQRR